MSGETGPSLTQDSLYRGLYLIGEGPLFGFPSADPAFDIYLNNVPIKDANGQVNFDGLSYNFRYGMPTQTHISSFDSASDPVAIAQKVLNASPYQVEIDTDYDAVVVTVGSTALYRIDSSGSIADQGVEYTIDYQANGSSTWITAFDEVLKAKQTAAWELSYRITLPAAQGPYLVRVRRVTEDNVNNQVFDDITFVRYEAVTLGKFTYPNCGLLAIEVDAKEYGDTIPSVSVRMKGLVINIPTNYDPVARTYATTGAGTTNGVWDGTFKKAWTNNPAWIFYDLLISNRYGLGQFVNPANNPAGAFADKWQLYNISQYCDGMVSDGMGGQEPRFTFNEYINTKDDAYLFLQNVATAFRGMLYFSTGEIYASADIPPAGISDIFSNADVEDGMFTYQSSPLNQRSSVVVAKWKNPANYYKEEYEVVNDNDAIFQFGYRLKTLNGFGVATRSLARRLAKWLLLTEKYQTQVVTFKTGLRGGALMPGTVIKIFDQYKAGIPISGRILNYAANGATGTFTLDQPVTLTQGQSQTLNVVLPDLTLATLTVSGPWGVTSTINTSSIPSQTPVGGAIWSLSSSLLDGAQYRVVNVSEPARGTYEVTAVLQYAQKYALIENGPAFVTAPTSVISTAAINPPTSVTCTEWYIQNPGSAVTPALTVSWVAPSDPRVTSYELQLSTDLNSTWVTVYTGSLPSWDSNGTALTVSTGAAYQARVRSDCDSLGTTSDWAYSATFDVTGNTTIPNPPTGLQAVGIAGGAVLTWTMPTNSDYQYVLVYTSSVNDSSTAQPIAQEPGSSYIITGVVGVETIYVWLKTVTYATSNNVSAFSTGVSVTTTLITGQQISAGAIALNQLGQDVVDNLNATGQSVFQANLNSTAFQAYQQGLNFLNGQTIGTVVTNLTSTVGNTVSTLALIGSVDMTSGAFVIDSNNVQSSPGTSLAAALTEVTGTANGNTATITAIQKVTNGLQAVSSMSVSVNGSTAGWEIDNNYGVTQFAMVAQSFLFVDPNGGNAIVPLAYSNGVWTMNAALYVQSLAANSVTTLSINGYAVSDSVSFESTTSVPLGAINSTAQPLTTVGSNQGITFTSSNLSPISISMDIQLSNPDQSHDQQVQFVLARDGTTIKTFTGDVRENSSNISGGWKSQTHGQALDSAAAGNHVYTITAQYIGGGGNGPSVTDTSVILTQLKDQHS